MKTNKTVCLAILALATCSTIFMHAQTPKGADELALHEPVGPTNWAIKNEGFVNITMPEMVEALRIKRPYLQISKDIVVVRVTDEEWAKLVTSYPKDALQNADSSTELIFMAPKKP